MRVPRSPQDVISYWFGEGDLSSLEYLQGRMGLWFMTADPEFNKVQFGCTELVDRIAEQLTNNTLEEEWLTDEGVLATVLLLDQFPRMVYRGTARAFQYDSLTAALVRQSVENSKLLSNAYVTIQRFFMCVALQHSEELEDQTLGVRLAAEITHDASPDVQQYFNSLPGYPMEHHDVIVKFGRYPSRNYALGRACTEEETAWMASPECPGWARSQLPSLS